MFMAGLCNSPKLGNYPKIHQQVSRTNVASLCSTMRWSNNSEQTLIAHNMKSQEHDIEQDSEVHVTCDSTCAELGVRMVDTWGVHRNRAGATEATWRWEGAVLSSASWLRGHVLFMEMQRVVYVRFVHFSV